jgi:hypothetical protein
MWAQLVLWQMSKCQSLLRRVFSRVWDAAEAISFLHSAKELSYERPFLRISRRKGPDVDWSPKKTLPRQLFSFSICLVMVRSLCFRCGRLSIYSACTVWISKPEALKDGGKFSAWFMLNLKSASAMFGLTWDLLWKPSLNVSMYVWKTYLPPFHARH